MGKTQVLPLPLIALSIYLALPASTLDVIKARDGTVCSGVNGPFPIPKPSTGGAPSTTVTPSNTTTPSPSSTTPSCTYMGPQPPDDPSGFCTCDGKSTLPLLTLTDNNAPQSESCSYTAQPTASVTQPNPSPSVTTYSDTCQVCTPYAYNGDDCSLLSGCTPLKGAATVELGSSVVNYGTLTSTALYTSVSNVLVSLCPTASQACSTETATIKGISYVSSDIEKETLLKTDGELEISVQSSQYTVSSLRDALIQSTATALQYSATTTQCKNIEYTDYNDKRKRWWHPITNLMSRQLYGSDWTPQKETVNLCTGVNFAGAHYYAPNVNATNVVTAQGTDYIDVATVFQIGSNAGLELDLLCDFASALIDALAVVAPEFAVEDVDLGSAIGLVCKKEGDKR